MYRKEPHKKKQKKIKKKKNITKKKIEKRKKVLKYMDRSWIKAKRTSVEYDNGVKDFVDFARRNADDDSSMFYCPCVECLNEKRLHAIDIYIYIHTHLICEGFCKSYKVWV